MRTTLTIDDDVLAAAREIATTEQKTVGEIISGLARRAMRPANTRRKTRNGVPLLPIRSNTARVTSEMVQQLREDLL